MNARNVTATRANITDASDVQFKKGDLDLKLCSCGEIRTMSYGADCAPWHLPGGPVWCATSEGGKWRRGHRGGMALLEYIIRRSPRFPSYATAYEHVESRV